MKQQQQVEMTVCSGGFISWSQSSWFRQLHLGWKEELDPSWLGCNRCDIPLYCPQGSWFQRPQWGRRGPVRAVQGATDGGGSTACSQGNWFTTHEIAASDSATVWPPYIYNLGKDLKRKAWTASWAANLKPDQASQPSNLTYWMNEQSVTSGGWVDCNGQRFQSASCWLSLCFWW